MKGRIKIDRSGKKIGIVALFKSIFPRCQRSPKQTRSKYALQWPAISNNRGDSIVQRHFTSFLGRRPLDARDPIGEFESRFGRWTRFECKPTRDRSLSLSLSVPGSQKSDERDGEDIPDAPDGAFRSEPPDVYIRPQNSSRHAALLPLYGNSHDYAISALVWFNFRNRSISYQMFQTSGMEFFRSKGDGNFLSLSLDGIIRE